MDILRQCEIWRNAGKYENIIEMLENLSEEVCTTEIKLELASAYLDYALNFEEPDNESLKKALYFLLSIEKEKSDDANWNYRIGYVYYSLKNELKAMPYLSYASEYFPEDEQLLKMIEYCKNMIMFSDFSCNFKQRTELAWKAFVGKEEEIMNFMNQEEKSDEYGDKLVSMVTDIFKIAFKDPWIEIGFNGEKHEIIFSAEGRRILLFLLKYFVSRVPEKLKKNWSFLVGRNRNINIGIRINEINIDSKDVQVLVKKLGDKSVSLTLYCEKLLSQLKKNEYEVWQILSILIDQNIGELSEMAYVNSFDIVDTPLSDEHIYLSELSKKLEELGMPFISDPTDILESYMGYKFKPNEDPNADWRMDIMAGSTNCSPLIQGYLYNDNKNMEILYENGIAAGFLVYYLEPLREAEGSNKIFDFRDELINYLEENCGKDNIYITGGATGIYYGYVDFIAWDLRNVLTAASKFFENSEIDFAAYHSFVREAVTLWILKREH